MRFSKILFLFLWAPLHGQQLGFALDQINASALLDEHLSGKGIKIGIIDGGFLHADRKATLRHLFDAELVAAYKDYLDSTDSKFSGSKAWDDGHGTEVWEMIAGYHPENEVQFGLATQATYFLARTDHGGYERREEEKNAIAAMEWMARQGVQIINLSLGYNYGYTDKSENYTPAQMNGKSTILTQAVDRIAQDYNILIVVAAGNDGDKKWRIIDAPADAQHALTVGATKYKTWDNMAYSSRGPGWLDYVKPEVACFASSGTSFSTPIITGLAACLLERKPELTAPQLKEIIIQSANLTHPNNYIGYGVPDAAKALALVDGLSVETDSTQVVSSKRIYRLSTGTDVPYVAVYHKKGWEVVDKETIRARDGSYRIKQYKDAVRSTVIWEQGQLEILWKD